MRARIQAEFAKLGVKTSTYTAFTCNAWRGFAYIPCATVTDILAEVVPGEGKAIVLLAHYDSVPAGPGASDDESGVSIVLETARALRTRGLRACIRSLPSSPTARKRECSARRRSSRIRR